MRVREWYGWHFPELVRVVPDNYLYARVVLVVKNKADVSDEMIPALKVRAMDDKAAH